MRRPFLHNGRRDLITAILLVALAFRAYVPVGFMPMAGLPFALELCPGEVPAHMAAHHHHHAGGHAQFAHCPFGSAPASGPLSHIATPEPAAPMATAPAARFERLRLATRFDHAHQPRAPPRLV